MIARLTLSGAARGAVHRVRTVPVHLRALVRRIPDNLELQLADLRPGDRFIADQIYSGVFPLAGKLLSTEGRSPFELKPPSYRFARQLHSFTWLRHFSVARSELGSSNARAHVTAWINGDGLHVHPAAREDSVTALRLMAFLQHSRLLLAGSDAPFYRAFMRAVLRDLVALRARLGAVRDSATRIRMLTAICAARLILPGHEAGLQRALKALTSELGTAVLPDGGHISRNPEIMLDVLADIVPLRMLLASEAMTVPDGLAHAMDRMFAALRFFRHMDGEVALFNGVGAIVPDSIATLLRHDDTGSTAPLRLPQTGFERLAMGGTAIIADVGPVPDGSANPHPHAGTLSFEMSSGRHRYIVNSGVDSAGPDAYRQISRQTVAHSTLTINDRSSATFTTHEQLQALLGTALVEGPSSLDTMRIDAPERQGFRASHDGYGDEFGMRHERQIVLSDGGSRISGVDRLVPMEGRSSKGQSSQAAALADSSAVIRFHLHPDIHVILDGDGNLMLMADSDDSWTFEAEGMVPKLVETFFFARLAGPQKSKAIALEFKPGTTSEVKWSLTRTGIGSRY
jgi:uncharacterized heparinase superfamily protein